MATLSHSPTLSPLPHFPRLRNPKPNPRLRTLAPRRSLTLALAKETERGVEFDTGNSFFGRENAVGRDLAILAIHAATLHHCHSLTGGDSGGLRVLDAMCGCSVRALRYLRLGGADFVWANDAFEDAQGLILSNLAGERRVSPEGEWRWVVTHFHANRVLAESSPRREFFDLVDVDSFGSDSSFMRLAISAVKFGGLLYVTSTDGYSSGGHRPHHSLASYGAFVRPMPFSNEVGLRMLIGGAFREAAASGCHISPLFSYYSYHGPVFRVMLQVDRGKLHGNNLYGFISYCNRCGNSRIFSWEELGQILCPCSNGEVSRSAVVVASFTPVSRSVVGSGPLWTGPLHNTTYATEMLKLAGQWGWAYTNENVVDLEKFLNAMISESTLNCLLDASNWMRLLDEQKLTLLSSVQ